MRARRRIATTTGTRGRRALWVRRRYLALALVAVVPAAALIAPVTPLANAADSPPHGVCMTPPVGIVNTSWPLVADVTAGATTLQIPTLAADQVGAYGAPQPGDLFLISQLIDATINSTNTSNYGANNGTGRGYTSLGRTGLWEYARVQSYDATTGVVTLNDAITGGYLTTGFSRAQVTRVPEYVNLTLTADLTAPALQVVSGDRVAGGVMAVSVTDTLNLNGFSIHADALGFAGGEAVKYSSVTTGQEYVSNQYPFDGGKGLGIAATFNDLQNNLGGAYAQGAPANGGGGGGDHDGSGAGGGNGGVGGRGGLPWFSSSASARALGGTSVPIPSGETLAQRLIGGGGGGGGNGNQNGQTSGGTGGGIVVVDAGKVSNSGSVATGKGEIRANGEAAAAAPRDGGGGGGAAGTVLLRSDSAVPASVKLKAIGGLAPNSQGDGGGGGGGRIATSLAPASLSSVNPSGGTATGGGGSGSGTGGLNAVTPIPRTPTATVSQQRSCDFGDLPDKSSATATGDYQTLADHGYAAHYGVGVRLGADRDSEQNANHNATATGDLGDDGVTLTHIPLNATSLSVPVSVQNVTETSCVVGYLDANDDGAFTGAGESSPGISGITADGTRDLTFTGFKRQTTIGQMVALRVRVSSDPTFCAAARTGGALSVGYAANGEIEDYLIPVAVATDLSVSKALTVPTSGAVIPGAPIRWEVTVTNNGDSDVRAPGFVVKDTIPDGVTPSSTGWTCAVTSGSATCPTGLGTGDLDANILVMRSGAVMQFTYTGTAGDDIPAGTVSNTATVTPNGAGAVDTNHGNNSATATSPVQSTAGLKADKTTTVSAAVAGTQVSYTLTAKNLGPHTALNATLTDSLPAGFTVVSLNTTRDGASCDVQTLSCSAPTLPIGETLTATLVAQIPPGAATGSATNSMVVSTSSVDPDGDDNTDTATITVTRSSDFTVDVSAAAGVAGETVSVPVSATNNGQSTGSGTITVPVPTGLSFNATSTTSGCTLSGTDVTCATGTLAPKESADFMVAFSIPATTAPGTIATGATVSSSTDGESSNNSDDSTITVTASANLAISKTLNDEPIIAGKTSEWTITVSNAGPSTARSLKIADTLPDNLTLTGITVPAGAACPDEKFPCTATSLNPGSSLTFTVSATLAADTDAGTEVVNTASVSSVTPDPNTDNNSGSDSGTTEIDVDVQISKTVSPTTVAAGETATYTLTASNQGASLARNITISDTLPTPISINGTVTATGGGTCTVAGQAISCTADILAPNSSIVVTVPVRVASTAPAGTITNSATVDTRDSEPASIAAGLAVTRTADVSVSKALAEAGAKVAGEKFDLVLTASNAGPSTASNVTVIDTLPAGLTFVSGPTGCSADESGSMVTCTADTVAAPAGGVPGTAPFTITVIADPSTPAGTITNKATVSADETDPDDSAPDSTGNSTSLDIDIERRAALTLTKADNLDPASAGDTIGYTLTIGNDGPSVATGIVLTDTLPSGLTFSDEGSTDACSSTEDTGTHTVTCTLTDVSLLPGQSIPIEIAVNVPPGILAGSILTNSAAVNGTGSEEATATETTTIDARADLTIDKTVTSGPVVPGEAVVWQLAVTNTGPSVARKVTITDRLDPRVTFVPADPEAEGTESSPECSVNDDGVVRCDLGTMQVGTQKIQIVGNVAADATGTLQNTATLDTRTPGSCLGEPEPCASTVSSDLVPTSALTFKKTVASDAPLVPGDVVIFAGKVTNAGPSAARDVIVTDTLAEGLTFVPDQSSTSCTADGKQVTCAVGTLSATEITVKIAARIDADRRGEISNTAAASSPTGPNCTREQPCESTVGPLKLEPRAKLVVQKTTSATDITAGDSVTFDISIKNEGLSDATNVALRDELDPGLTFVSASTGCTADGQVVSCDPVTVLAGKTARYTITAKLATDFGDTLKNSVVVTSPDDPNCVTGCAAQLQAAGVARSADLAISASSPTIAPGSTGTVTVAVQNNGPSTAAGSTQFTVTVPTSLTVTAPETCVQRVAGVWTCTIADPIAPNATPLEFAFTVSVPANHQAPETLDVSADITQAGSPDPVAANNKNPATITVAAAEADLSVTKTLATSPFVPGARAVWEVVVHNAGPSTARGVTVKDTLDASLSFVPYLSSDPLTSSQSCSAEGQQVTCAVSEGVVGDTVFRIAVRSDPSATGQVSNTATASSPSDPSCGPDCIAISGPHVYNPRAELSITKTLATSPLVAGGPISYDVTIANAGPSTATSVVFTDELPDEFISASATPGAACETSGSTVRCTSADLAPGASASFTIAGMLAADATGTTSNTATGSAATDPECSAGCSVTSGPHKVGTMVDLVATATPLALIPGTTGTVTMTAANDGRSEATDVSLVYTPPAEATVTGVPEGCVATGDPVGVSYTCPIPALSASSDPVPFKFEVSISAAQSSPATLAGLVEVSGSQPDVNPSRNIAAANIIAKSSTPQKPIVLPEIDGGQEGPSSGGSSGGISALPVTGAAPVTGLALLALVMLTIGLYLAVRRRKQNA